jgi:hypothetical protein
MDSQINKKFWEEVIAYCSFTTYWVSQSQNYFSACSLPPISSSWRQAPWDSRPKNIFCNWILSVLVLMNHILWRENGVCLLWIGFVFVNFTYCTYASSFRVLSICQSQSQSYFSTSGLLSINSSWRQAPWDSRPVILFSNWTLAIIVLM